MSEHSPTPDESQPVSWRIEQTVVKGSSAGENLTIGNVNQTTHVYLPPPPKTEPKHFTVPYSRNTYFTGREAILTQLHETLGKSGTAALSQAKAISGLGGVGKTQTAVEYAHRYFYDQSFYDWVLWVNASNLTLASSFGSIATDLALPNHQENKLDENVAAVLHWLATTDRWLLIFDNVDAPKAVKPFRPNHPQGRILITSRIQRLESLGVWRAIELTEMTAAEAHEFLLKRTQTEAIDPTEQAALEALAETLGYLPLALEQAAAYILAKKVSFATYLRSYQKRRLQLLEKEKPQVGDYPESVATTWTINFEVVQTSSPAAADLLRMSAFLAPDNIPWEILLLGKDHLGELLSAALAEAAEDELVIPELLEELSRYSLIRLEDDYCYSIHRMVQEVLRNDLPPEQQQQWIDRTVKALNATFPEPKFENWQKCDRLIEHVLILDLKQIPQSYALSRLLNDAACYLDDQGRYEVVETLYLHALQVSRILFGEKHRNVANNLNNLGSLYRVQGRYAEAEKLFLQTLQMRKALLGENHPDVANSLNGLAYLYSLQGRYEKAEPLYLQALQMRKTLLGENHPDMANILDNLAMLYGDQGRYREAEPLYLQALQMRKTLLGENHPDVAISLNNLATLYNFQNRYSEAELLYLQCLQMNGALSGTNHPDVATNLNNLAVLYNLQGRYDEAEPLYLQALQVTRILLGDNHPDTATSLNNLAGLYCFQCRFDEAESLYLQALSILFGNLNEDHPSIQTVWESFGFFLQRVIEAGQTYKLSDHPLTQAMLQQLEKQ